MTHRLGRVESPCSVTKTDRYLPVHVGTCQYRMDMTARNTIVPDAWLTTLCSDVLSSISSDSKYPDRLACDGSAGLHVWNKCCYRQDGSLMEREYLRE